MKFWKTELFLAIASALCVLVATVIIVVIVVVSISLPAAHCKAKIINAEFGSHYTAWQYMFASEEIKDIVIGGKYRIGGTNEN